MTISACRPIIRAGAAGALVALLVAASPAEAQRVIPGFARSDQTDVAGVQVTSSDLLNFEPGTVKSFTCPVAWGVRTTAEAVQARLTSADLRIAGDDAAGVAVGADVQRDLLLLLTDAEGSDQAEARIAGALAAGNPGAAREARGLAESLEGLILEAGRMDPARPGLVGPMRVNSAVSAFNEFVDESSAAFLASPPEEMRAIQAVLSRLVIAALENADRDVRAGDAAPGGLACAAPAAAVTAVAPPPEIAVAMCVLRPEGPAEVAGIVNPATGDTTVVVAGERRAFSEVYPRQVALATEQPWYAARTPIAFGEGRYVQYGLPREMPPGTVARAGTYEGVTVYTARGRALRPGAIYLPTDVDCEFQEYRRAEEVTRVRG